MKENNISEKKYQEFWNRVDENLSEGGYSGYKMAIIETEKILLMALKDKKFYGKNIDEKIYSAKSVVHNPEKLNYSRSMYKKIIQEPGFDVSEDDTKEILTGYYNSISNIVKTDKKSVSRKEKIGQFLQGHFVDYIKNIKKILIATSVIFLLIFVLIETTMGNEITQGIADFTRFLFYTVILATLKILAVVLIIIGSLYYWQNRKDKQS